MVQLGVFVLKSFYHKALKRMRVPRAMCMVDHWRVPSVVTPYSLLNRPGRSHVGSHQEAESSPAIKASLKSVNPQYANFRLPIPSEKEVDFINAQQTLLAVLWSVAGGERPRTSS